jgi:hypothetical protein
MPCRRSDLFGVPDLLSTLLLLQSAAPFLSFLFWCHCCPRTQRRAQNGHCATAVQLPNIFRSNSNLYAACRMSKSIRPLFFFCDEATRLSPTHPTRLRAYETNRLFSKRRCFHMVANFSNRKTAKGYWWWAPLNKAVLSGAMLVYQNMVALISLHDASQLIR